MKQSEIQDKFRGSLAGGAIGDALGYEVEFLRLKAIRKRFGNQGITRYVTHNGIAEFSDDTQMTLFTLEGLLNGVRNTGSAKADETLPHIEKAYLNWYQTQTESPKPLAGSELGNHKELWSRRAPGITCLNALESISNGYDAVNDSKGCGGVMRVAPIGLYHAIHEDIYDYTDTERLAGLSAEITHKHPASTLASALFASLIRFCISYKKIDKSSFGMAVTDHLSSLQNAFPGYSRELKKFGEIINLAIRLANSDISDTEAIQRIGEGWIGDEAIAIAIYSVLRHITSFEDCIICAVNHDGDSDSTGAIAGNFIGAILGYSAIPEYYLDSLEMREAIEASADALSADFIE